MNEREQFIDGLRQMADFLESNPEVPPRSGSGDGEMSGKTAPWMIAFHLSFDVTDVISCRYQPTRYSNPGVYTIADWYFCCPTAKQKLPKDLGKWEPVFTDYGRTVYRSDGQED